MENEWDAVASPHAAAAVSAAAYRHDEPGVCGAQISGGAQISRLAACLPEPGAICRPNSRRAVRRPGGRKNKVVLAVAALLLCLTGRARAKEEAWPFVGGNSRHIEVAGETLDTTLEPSVLLQHQAGGRRGAIDNSTTYAQYYVQLTPDADQRQVRKAIGNGLNAYVPNNAYIVLASGATALKIAGLDGVQWVGKRPARHKVSLSLAEQVAAPRKSKTSRESRGSAARNTSRHKHQVKDTPFQGHVNDEMEMWQSKNVVSLYVTAHTQADWDNAQLTDQGTPEEARDNGRSAKVFAARCYSELIASGIAVLDTYSASDEKVVVRIKPAALRDTLEWLSEQPEAMWVEKKRNYYPFMSGASRLLADGPSTKSEESKATSISLKGIDGSGQIIAVADTGMDWDSCFFWQNKNSQISPWQGVEPPFQVVDSSRRKLISYNWHQACSVCDRCPVDVEEDFITFVSANGLLEGQKAWRGKFPDSDLHDDLSVTGIAPRNYNSAGATVKYSIEAVSRNTASEYVAMGAGAFDIKIDIQIFVVPRGETDAFDVDNRDHWDRCLNDCKNSVGNIVASANVAQERASEQELVVLDAAFEGYGVIIANRGLIRRDGGDPIHAHVTLKGKIQFKTALKPCGDNGDDRIGHGTHTVGVAVGSAETPNMTEFDAQKNAASQHNGMAPGAKVYFEDVMQNASPDCNIPGKICPKVSDMTIPVDLQKDLFAEPYKAGARIHLNSWGCKILEEQGERPGLCNKYTIRSRDVDAFVYQNPDFLVIFAAGENGLLDAEGSIAEPGTCKNCLTVGSTNTFQFRYREAVQARDPQTDICKACQHPYFCSRSDMIGGVLMEVDDSVYPRPKLQAALGELPACCNDTLHEFYRVEDEVIEAQQWFTVHLPNLTTMSPDISSKIKRFNWLIGGASIIYDFKAKRFTDNTKEDPGIQVFVLLREDFTEYFEAGTMSCDSENAPMCRSNPCKTERAKQNDKTERCMSIDATYKPVPNCEKPQYDLLTGRASWTDLHCHVGNCQRLKKSDKAGDPKDKDTTPEGKWGTEEEDQCPGGGIKCCNDKFLSTMCINQPCTEVKSRLRGLLRSGMLNNIKLAKYGFGIAVRNMNDFPIKLTGTVEIRNMEYPCTLRDCCGEVGNPAAPQTECCSNQYPRVFGAGRVCDQCKPVPAPGICHPNEVGNLPSWTARGPGQSNFLENIGGRQFKPELVAPGLQIVSANSDGFVHSVGEPEDFEVQCGLPSKVSITDTNRCFVNTADRYDNTTAVRAQSGSSIAAALVAGSAALLRHYLVDGYYPAGIKNVSNTKHTTPSAALIKGMLINSARSVGGTVDTYTYKYPLPCDPTKEVCVSWTKPKPEDCGTDPTFSKVDCYIRRDQMRGIPSMAQGFGRPMLTNVMWTNDSAYSLFLDENYVPNGFQRSYTFPILETSPEFPLKITLTWTDAPGTPEAKNILVNDLDLIVQLSSQQVLYNPNQGVTTVVDVFEPYYGNDGGRTRVRDRSNVVEQVTIDGLNSNTNMTVVVMGTRVPSWMNSVLEGQNFALVITGQIKPKYEAWNLTRSAVLQFVDDNARGSKVEDERLVNSYNYLDTFKTGMVTVEDITIRIKSISAAMARDMIKEADEDRDGELSLDEWKAAVMTARSRARVPTDPELYFGKADASLLEDDLQVTDTDLSFAVRPSYSIVLGVSLTILSLLSTGRQL